MLVRKFCRLSARVALALALAMLAFADAPVHAQAPAGFPYVAYVIEPETYIRSGPGRQHYPTGQLPAGYAVEVYRHDADGWCAIRPPEGSFSLVPVHQLRVLDDRTAEVIADGVVARVGSLLGAQRNAVQVLLQRGEAVQLVEPPKSGDPWARVAPPSGEFRWIAARRLSRTPPTEGSPKKLVAAGGWQSQSSGQAYEGPATSNPIESTPEATAIPWPGEEPARHTGDAFTHLSPVAAAGDEVEIVAGSPAATQLAGFEEAAQPTTPAAAAAPIAPPLQPIPTTAAPVPAPAADQASSPPPRVRFPGSGSTAPTDQRVAELHVRLSQTVVQTPANWQLASLREETAALLAQEPSPEIRDQLRDLLDRVATFETIQARYLTSRPVALPAVAPTQLGQPPQFAAAPMPNGASPATPPPAIGSSNTPTVLDRVQSDLGRSPTTLGAAPLAGQEAPITEAKYDAVGTLKPVVSRRENAPRFALVDDHGDVVTFVSASPELNLQPFLGQRIGVKGNRGFMPEYRRAHVTASRVTPLEETVVR